MDPVFADWLRWGVMVVAGMIANFAAMRARLNAMDKRADDIESNANRANQRIDELLLKR